MSCAHEHHKHEHDHEKESDRGQEYSLYKFIDTSKVIGLNERQKGQALNCFKAWDARLNQEKFLESDDDVELILYIPFTAAIKLKSIMMLGGDKGTSPKKMKM